MERVGRGDHFFELGGHSLAAVRVATRVAERLARDVPVRTLFEAPTLAQYAQRVMAAARSEAVVEGECRVRLSGPGFEAGRRIRTCLPAHRV